MNRLALPRTAPPHVANRRPPAHAASVAAGAATNQSQKAALPTNTSKSEAEEKRNWL